MTRWVELDPAIHGATRVAVNVSPRYGDDVGVVSVLPCEFPRLLAHYPVMFRKSAQTGQFEPAALLGFANRENLFLDGDRWDADYVPLQVQRQPFTLLPPDADSDAGTARIAIDADSPRVSADASATPGFESLFTAQGQPTAHLRRVAGILQTFASGAGEAIAFAQAVADLDLIEAVTVDVTFVDRSQVNLQGLYTIKPQGLETLPTEALLTLRERGFLRWAYFQLASMSQLGALVARKNRRLSGLTRRKSG